MTAVVYVYVYVYVKSLVRWACSLIIKGTAGQVRTKKPVVLDADFDKCVGIGCQEMEDVAYRATGRVVEYEYKEVNLTDGQCPQFGVELFGPDFASLGE